jgi:hypothetical protein
MLRMGGEPVPGMARTADRDAGVIRVRVPMLADEAALAAVGARGRSAARRSLRPLLVPGAVAVVGARRHPAGSGTRCVGRYWAAASPIRCFR